MKHTQGEWKLLPERGNCIDIISDEWGIAKVHGNINHSGVGAGAESTANAKLIAAAPALLEVVEEVIGLWNEGMPLDSATFNRASLAVKKATE